MTVINIIHQWLKLFCRKYRKSSLLYRYAVSSVIIVGMTAIFVNYPQYWIAAGHLQDVFSGSGAWNVPDGYNWRLLCLSELAVFCMLTPVFRHEKYTETKNIISIWTFGWFVIPVGMSLLWLIFSLIRAFLNREFPLSVRIDDISYLVSRMVIYMMYAQFAAVSIALCLAAYEWRNNFNE